MPSGWFADRFGGRAALTRIVIWWSARRGGGPVSDCDVSPSASVWIGEARAFPRRLASRPLLPVLLRDGSSGSDHGAAVGAITQPLVVVSVSRIACGRLRVLRRAGLRRSQAGGLVPHAPRSPSVKRELALYAIGGGRTRAHSPGSVANAAAHPPLISPARCLRRDLRLVFLSHWLHYRCAPGFDLTRSLAGALPLLAIAAGVYLALGVRPLSPPSGCGWPRARSADRFPARACAAVAPLSRPSRSRSGSCARRRREWRLLASRRLGPCSLAERTRRGHRRDDMLGPSRALAPVVSACVDRLAPNAPLSRSPLST